MPTHEEQLREALCEVLACLPPVARGDLVTLHRNQYERARSIIDAALSGKREGATTEECQACHAPLVYCGGEWRPPPLQTLTDEQLEHHHKPITREQFDAALAQGRRDADALERATPRRPGTFTTATPAAEVGAEARGAGLWTAGAAAMRESVAVAPAAPGARGCGKKHFGCHCQLCRAAIEEDTRLHRTAAPEARDYDPITSPIPIPAGDHNGPHGPLALDATAAGTSPSWGCCHPDEARDGKPENAPEEPR